MRRIIIVSIFIIACVFIFQHFIRNMLFEHMVIQNNIVKGIKKGIINKGEDAKILIIIAKRRYHYG